MENTHNKQHHDDIVTEEATQQAPVAPEIVAKQSDDESAKNQLLRVTADFANYRRRIEKERVEWVQVGQNAIIKAFLPVLDDIERAFSAAIQPVGASDAAVQSIRDGLALVEKNMRKMLDDLGVQEIMCHGAFDPHFHEALMQTTIDGIEAGTIVQVLSKGYTYKGVVVRHAKVSVAA